MNFDLKLLRSFADDRAALDLRILMSYYLESMLYGPNLKPLAKKYL